MAWSAITVGMGIILVGVHVARCLHHASLPCAISAHIMLAFLNILAAATLGVLIGFDKVYHFLPGFVLANWNAMSDETRSSSARNAPGGLVG